VTVAHFVNKESESFYLSKFQELCPNFPPGQIYPDERPDFRIRGANGDVGIEVTNFYREMSSNTRPTLQARRSTRHKIIEEAKRIYDLKGLPLLVAHVHFDFDFHCGQSEVHAFGERLAHLAECSVREHKLPCMWRCDEIQLKGVHLLDIRYTTKNPESRWSAPFASFVPKVSPAQLQCILDKKSKLCAEYRKKCVEVWLVIVMDRFDPSSFSLIPQRIQDHAFAHDFESAFLFHYNRSDEQEPPILLRKAANPPTVSETVSENTEK